MNPQPPVNKPYRTKLDRIIAELNLTQKDLAQFANVETYQVNKCCVNPKANVTLDTAKRICKALGKTLDEVFGD